MNMSVENNILMQCISEITTPVKRKFATRKQTMVGKKYLTGGDKRTFRGRQTYTKYNKITISKCLGGKIAVRGASYP